MKKTMPSIPAKEYPLRWKQVQKMMCAKKLGLLIAYADDRAAYGPAHVRWLANYPAHFD